jgi:hypothetical protein
VGKGRRVSLPDEGDANYRSAAVGPGRTAACSGFFDVTTSPPIRARRFRDTDFETDLETA